MSDELFQQGESSNEAGLQPGTVLGRAVGTNVGYVQNLNGVQIQAIIDAAIPPTPVPLPVTANTVSDSDYVDISFSNSSPGIITWSNLKTTLLPSIWTGLGSLISGGAAKTTVVDADVIPLSDSASSNATKKVSFVNLWTNYIKAKADAIYQPVNMLLTSLAALSNASGFLQNNGTGGLSWGTVSVDPFAYQPIGVPIPIKDHITGVSVPSNGSSYVYVKLTAGLTGGGGFNNFSSAALLTSESVSGSAPTVTATAVISLAGSPINGQTISLLNTEGRFLRASTSSGTLQDSALGAHTHTGTTGTESADHAHSGTTGTVSSDHTHYENISANFGSGGPGYRTFYNGDGSGANQYGSGIQTDGITANHVHSFSTGGRNAAHTHSFTSDSTGTTESRSRNIGVTYYMRIK